MKKILVPSDFSATAQEAFKFAATLAARAEGEIHVLHIIDLTFLHGSPSLSYSYTFNVDFLKTMEAESEAKFRAWREEYAPLTLPVKFKHTLGSLVSGIETYVRENKIDLVIMGTHGAGTGRIGSNTGKVIRHMPVPVIAVRKQPERPVKKIVVPVSSDEPDKKFIDQLTGLQQFFNASLEFLWVNTPHTFKNDYDSKFALQEFVQRGNFTNASIHVYSDHTVEAGIYRFARSMDADMIAIGTHAWKGLVHFFTGSIAEDIVNHADFPVWTYALNQDDQELRF